MQKAASTAEKPQQMRINEIEMMILEIITRARERESEQTICGYSK